MKLNRMLKGIVAVMLGLLAGAAAGVFVFTRWAQEFSARDEPSRAEVALARRLRRLSHTAQTKAMPNPVPLTAEVLVEARAHFADHCAYCHGNDGRGRTTIGQQMYPRVPDLTEAATQSFSDGELFHAIKFGVRLTGMPAWGEDNREDDTASWKLVHLVRNLSKLTAEQIAEMESLNPKPCEECLQEEEERRFLRGEDILPKRRAPTSPAPHKH